MDKKSKQKIVVSKNGPYIVTGDIPLAKEAFDTDNDGNPGTYETIKNYDAEQGYNLCRCGKSKNKPFCDGSHIAVGFVGTETAKNQKYADCSEKLEGPELDLTDAQCYCAGARFCHKGTWEHTQNSDDPKSKKIAIESACNCPSGRLVVWDKKTKKPIEPKFAPQISVLEDKAAHRAGPIFVKGGIAVESANGQEYEKRNRVTLCRCGNSKNKPFCDGSHLAG